MQHLMRVLSTGILLILVLVALFGCATRKYVTREIGNIEPQIAEVADAQAQQAERIDAVDRRARNGLNAANRAGTAADVANANTMIVARMAIDANLQADAAHQNIHHTMNRIDMVERRLENRIADLDSYVVGDRTTVTFEFDSSTLTKEAISKLDDIAGQIAQTPTGHLIELQGFTDNVGAEPYNLALSGRRAESVLRYLVSKDVPLHRISIVGLGKTNPVADNKTPQGRELNRRVEVRVLRLPGAVSTTIH